MFDVLCLISLFFKKILPLGMVILAILLILAGTTDLFYILKTKYDDLVLRITNVIVGLILGYLAINLLLKSLPDSLNSFNEDNLTT